MNRILAVVCALVFLLAACGGDEGQTNAPTVDAARLSAELLEREGLFSDVLEEVEPEVGLALYGIDAADLADGVFYLSGGATAEELSILVAADNAAAERVAQACRDRIERQIKAVRDYQPQEVAKLKAAVIRAEGTAVICLVPAAGQDGEQILNEAMAA